MKVRIISRKDIDGWILGKFARKLQTGLKASDTTVDIGEEPDPTADINHYMLYLTYEADKASPCDTLMITHVDTPAKLSLIRSQMQVARLGICMSAETMNLLIDSGIDAQKLCYVNPAHDSTILPKKIVVGITTAVYADGRKREQLLPALCKVIGPGDFRFVIMGSGWEKIVETIRAQGFDVEYHETFEYDTYIKLIPRLDYYLYMGEDEGSMGFVDALAAGVKTIVTPQGYHLDAKDGISFSFKTTSDLKEIFQQIAAEKNKLAESVKFWTWDHYAAKHRSLWLYLLTGQGVSEPYLDGLTSLITKQPGQGKGFNQWKARYKIIAITVNRFIHSKDKIGKIRRKIRI